jgi:cytochrome c oxidase cbb3-type subunit 3
MYQSMKPLFKKLSASILTACLLLSTTLATAADTSPAASSDYVLDVNSVLAACAFLLLMVVFVLGNTLRSTILYYHEKRKKETSKNKMGAKIFSILFAAILFSSLTTLAQEATSTESSGPSMIPESDVIRWVLYVVIGAEVIVIFLFTKLIRFFTGVDEHKVATTKANRMFPIDLTGIWNRMNKFQSIEEEASIDTGHSYDGIRELNNVTPPWFIAGFALSILFAMGYMYRYHIAASAPLQIEEYNIAVAEAKIKQAEYLKTQANNVDESSVVFLGADGIAAGQALFASNCVACHGDKGQGASVGPNLSDAYWIHKGSIQDIFKSIKYGWQEKGMKSWKEDFSANQIAQIASYVYALKGTNPSGAKEPQGDLYSEAATTVSPDSIALKNAAAITTKQ